MFPCLHVCFKSRTERKILRSLTVSQSRGPAFGLNSPNYPFQGWRWLMRRAARSRSSKARELQLGCTVSIQCTDSQLLSESYLKDRLAVLNLNSNCPTRSNQTPGRNAGIGRERGRRGFRWAMPQVVNCATHWQLVQPSSSTVVVAVK